MNNKAPPRPKEDLPTLGQQPPADQNAVMLLFKQVRDDGHYSAIGQVAASWSILEAIIDRRTHVLARIDPSTGICLTAQITGIMRKLDAYVSLAHLRNL